MANLGFLHLNNLFILLGFFSSFKLHLVKKNGVFWTIQSKKFVAQAFLSHFNSSVRILSSWVIVYKGFFWLITEAGQDYVRTCDKKECRGCCGLQWIRKKKSQRGWKGSLEVVWCRAGCPGLYPDGFWVSSNMEPIPNDSVTLLHREMIERLGIPSVIPCWEMFLFCSTCRQQRTI